MFGRKEHFITQAHISTNSFQQALTAFLNSQGTLRSGLTYGPACVQQTAIKAIQANCKQMMQMKVKEAIQVCNLET